MKTKQWAMRLGAGLFGTFVSFVSLNNVASTSLLAPNSQKPQTAQNPQNFSQLGLLGTQNHSADYAPNEIIIKLRTSNNGAAQSRAPTINPLERIKQQFSLRNEKSLAPSQNASANNFGLSTASTHAVFNNIFVLEFSQGDALALAQSISQDPDVEYAEPNYIYSHQLIPSDPYYSSAGTWGQAYDDLWGVKAINTESAWDLTLGENVVVAVIDSGVYRTHPDIEQNIWQNPNEIPNNNIDDDNNGFIDDVYGWSFAYSTNDTNDIGGHGTHVAGTIASVMNNGNGIVGVAPAAKILPIKGLSDQGFGYNDDLAASIIYAADMGAHVINNSWGGGGRSQVIADAIQYAHSQGVVIVSAAGNDNSPTSRYIPAGLPESITVSALDAFDARADFSNWGMKLDVAAPGVDVLSLLSPEKDISNADPSVIIDSTMWRASGTSMASPHVAGVAALIVSRNPNLSPEQVRYILRNSSDDLDVDGYDISFGYGRANATNAIQMVDTLGNSVPDLTASITHPFANGHFFGNNLELIGSAMGSNFDHYSVSWGEFTMETPIAYSEFFNSASEVHNDVLASLDLTQFNTSDEIAIKLEVFDTQNNHQDYYALVLVDNELKQGWPQFDAASFNRGGIDSAQTFADIDGDGVVEVISSLGNIVTAYTQDGTRLNGFPVEFPGMLTSSISIGDLDNDGLNDIIVPIAGHQNQQASLHAIKFDGSSVAGYPVMYQGFSGSPDFEIVFGQAPIVADVDADGELEIVVNVRTWALTQQGFGSERHQLAILNRSGEYEAGWPITISTQFSYYGGAMAAADLDKDGDMEIAVVGGQNNFSHLGMYEHTGAKRFGVDLGANHSFRRIFMEDITKNGRYEILTFGNNTDYVQMITVLDDQGNTLSGWPQTTSTLSADRVAGITVVSDSIDEKYILVATDETFRYYRPNGEAFGQPLPVLNVDGQESRIQPDKDIIRFDSAGEFPVTQGFFVETIYGVQAFDPWGTPLFTKTNGLFPKTPVVGDIDGDGILDVSTVSNDNFTSVWNYQTLPAGQTLTGWLTKGANNARTFSVETPYESTITSNYPSMNIRGSINGWTSTAMILVEDFTWEVILELPEATQTLFKFDVYGDWQINFGDNEQDGTAEQGGDNIATNNSGEYVIRFNDSTLQYSITPVESDDWQRTVVYMYGETNPGEDMFLRGGIDWDYSRNVRGIDCAINPFDCAIPIRHNLRPEDPTRANDFYLDWYGAETGQGNVEGSPLVWTTNFWPSDWGPTKTLENDGVGLDSENQWGMHYWKLDVMMDCSKTANGWFELKSFISNGPGWEGNVSQPGAPYSSNNHFAECGKTNVFRRGESNPVTIQ